MPLITASKTQPSYDVIIVGSGAGGAQAAYTLTLGGARVLMLEAGRNYDARSETPMFQPSHYAPLRGTPTPDKPFGFYDATVDGGWTVPGEPYTSASDRPELKFAWWRARMLGGRTNHWGRIALRNGPYDFKPRTRDGLGFDWPLGYDDLAPYYDKVEMLIGVYGSNEGIENSPDSPPGVLLPPPKMRAGEQLARARGAKLGLRVVPVHRAVLSTALDADRIAPKLHPGNPKAQRLARDSMHARAACFWATNCGRGCSIGAAYQSPLVHLPPALESGNLDLVTDAMVREVTVDARGRATGVVYIDKHTGQERRALGRAVVLAASACESVRVLLNSKSTQFPQGLANSSGLVGRYVMDSVGSRISGQVPLLENLPLHNEDGAGGLHVYIPWTQHRDQLAGKLGFARGYHLEFGTGRRMPELGIGSGMGWLLGNRYGPGLKDEVRRYYGSLVFFNGRGEMIPNDRSFCELDPAVKDKWGIPVLRFHWHWSEHETRQAVHIQRTIADLIQAMGGRTSRAPTTEGAKAIEPPGSIIHEVGGAIMGDDSARSVTNQWCQTWDVKNLFLMDAAPFCSNSDKNPTLTIMALAWRSSDYLLEALRRGDV